MDVDIKRGCRNQVLDFSGTENVKYINLIMNDKHMKVRQRKVRKAL